jgi:DNA invertase Pin-like site-specific DNA recombinase
LGGPAPLVEVSDDALGKSGGSAPYRHGLQRLVAEVALGQGGLVSGLEIARRARHKADCQPLLPSYGLTQPLLGDAEAMDALTPLNERLVLGLKGTRAAAELLTRRARRQGGLRQKAARGARATTLPVGVV